MSGKGRRTNTAPGRTKMTTKSLKLLHIADVAERLELSTNTVYTLAQRGELPAFKLAGKWRVRPEALEAWIRQQAAEAEEGLDFSEGLG